VSRASNHSSLAARVFPAASRPTRGHDSALPSPVVWRIIVGWRVRFSQSARRHRIGKARALHVIEGTDPSRVSDEEAPDRLVWLGVDDRGLELEVVALDLPDYLLVIHVMPTRLRRRRR